MSSAAKPFETSDPTTALVPCMPFGYVVDVLAELVAYLAIELAGHLPEGEILTVGHVLEPMRRANEILVLHGRPSCDMAAALVDGLDEARATAN